MADGNEAAPGDKAAADAQPDKEFFLALAERGKVEWNKWRLANKDVPVSFADSDFRFDKINFEGFEFGDEAKFARATFGDDATFELATFGNNADFQHARFGQGAKFNHATFGDGAIFELATFGNNADFQHATFGDGANFDGAAFGSGADFYNTVFKGHVGFAKKSGDNRFLSISFANARFNGEADFSGRTFEGTTNFTNSRFYYPPDFDGGTNAARINFTGAHISFVRPGHLHWTCKTEVPVRLRALRKIAEDTKNHDLERDLYIEERKAERGVYLGQLLELDELKRNLEDIDKQQKHVWLEWRLRRRARNAHWLGILAKPDKIARLAIHGFRIGVMGLYWALSDYGRNFLVPAIWLGLSVPFFDRRYTEILARLMAKAPDVDKYKQAVGMLALGNAVPFVGPLTIDSEIKTFLFCPGGGCPRPLIPPECYQWLVLSQNLISIILVFFIGLALRNYFKIK
jgi:Pentapeptide repeats (9 copies)